MKAVIFSLISILTSMAADQNIHKVLTSAERGIHLESWSTPPNQKWSIEKSTLHGGKQEGVDLIKVNNGKLSFTVCPTRGMGVMDASMGAIRLGWDSPVKEIVHPKYINLQSRGGLGWLEGFNELIVRCGLEFAGHPGKDKFINNTGDEAEMDLTLHGKIGNIPASEVEVITEPNGLIRIRGRVDERMFYGPKLEMWTEISTMPGSNSFTIQDSIKNYGAYDQEFQLIYHANFGPTLLEENAKFIGALQRVAPFNQNAAKDIQSFTKYKAPTKGFIEQVYCIWPLADAQGRSLMMLENRAGNQAVSLQFSTKELPFFTLWKNTTASEEGYVTGLEPGTGFPFNRSVERKAGRVPKLKPGETRNFSLTFTILDSSDSVQAARKSIETITGGRVPQLDSQPLTPSAK